MADCHCGEDQKHHCQSCGACPGVPVSDHLRSCRRRRETERITEERASGAGGFSWGR